MLFLKNKRGGQHRLFEENRLGDPADDYAYRMFSRQWRDSVSDRTNRDSGNN